MEHYRPPRWLSGSGPLGGNLQTLWPALVTYRLQHLAPNYQRERWTTPDGDFIDVDWQSGSPERPLLVLFHGLEGSSSSHYAQVFATWARKNNWRFVVPHFRGCSGEINLAPRAYHSGDFEEVGWILSRLRLQHQGPIVAVGISLGGNALLRWAQESEESAAKTVLSIGAISSPMDLTAAGHAIGRGFNRHVYSRNFLRTMVPKALRKLAQHPGLFDKDKMRAVRDLYTFDQIFTAPLHGFRSTEDYWARCSSRSHLHRIRIPTLLLNARNDPFIPAHCLPRSQDVGSNVILWQPAQGGHVGFPQGRFPLPIPEQLMNWLAERAGIR